MCVEKKSGLMITMAHLVPGCFLLPRAMVVVFFSQLHSTQGLEALFSKMAYGCLKPRRAEAENALELGLI